MRNDLDIDGGVTLSESESGVNSVYIRGGYSGVHAFVEDGYETYTRYNGKKYYFHFTTKYTALGDSDFYLVPIDDQIIDGERHFYYVAQDANRSKANHIVGDNKSKVDFDDRITTLKTDCWGWLG